MPGDLVDRLEVVIRRHILKRMGPDPAEDLVRMSLPELMLVYGNWRARIPSPRPRKVHTSSVLAASPAYGEYRDVLDDLRGKIETGKDLTPHLSRKVRTSYERAQPSRPHSKRDDLDLLVADWGVHHLHLSTTIEADGFVKRTGDLLFASFADEDAYLIDIRPHNSWTDVALLETVVREWPSADLLMGSLSGVRLTSQVDDADRRSLRNAGVAQPLEIDGRVYMPPSQTTAGTPLVVTQNVNQVMHTLRLLHENGTAGLLDAEGPPARGAYWRPTVLDDDTYGFADGERFVAVGRIA